MVYISRIAKSITGLPRCAVSLLIYCKLWQSVLFMRKSKNHLRNGVYECVEDEEKQITVTKALSSIHVYDVLNMELQSLSKLDEIAASVVDTNDVNLDFEPAYVIIRCTEADAQTLIRLEKAEALHLVLQRTAG